MKTKLVKQLCAMSLLGSVACSVVYLQAASTRPVSGHTSDIEVCGRVHNQGKHTYKPGTSLKEIIQQSGGLSAFANTRQVRIMNPANPEPKFMHFCRKLHDSLRPVESFIEEAWNYTGVPFDSPGFEWLEPPAWSKAVVNLETSADTYILDEGDQVIVPEITINF